MDCNSFSYAPTMLDAPENTLNSCENYTASPPGPELTAFIEALPDRHGGTI